MIEAKHTTATVTGALTRRSTLGALASIAAIVPASAVAAAVCPADPIFVLIEGHRQARAAFLAAIQNEPPFRTPEHDAWEAREYETGDRFVIALQRQGLR